MPDLCVVIPMKDPVFSKQRLSPFLPSALRKALAVKLFKRTLKTLNGTFPHWQKLVVTPALYMADIASSLGCAVVFEEKGSDLNQALTQATQWSIAKGFQRQLILPADIAKLERSELDALVALSQSGTPVVIASSHDGGTNALCTSPPNAIRYQFGEQSSLAHQQAAIHAGHSHITVQPVHLSQDIDQPSDLHHINDVMNSLIA